MLRVELTNENWLSLALETPDLTITDIHVVNNTESFMLNENIMCETILRKWPTINHLIWEDKRKGSCSYTSDLFRHPIKHIEFICSEKYPYPWNRCTPPGCIREVIINDITVQSHIGNVEEFVADDNLIEYYLKQTEYGGHYIKHIFWWTLIQLLVSIPVRQDIVYLDIEYIDRGIHDGHVFSELLRSRFPNLQTLKFTENYARFDNTLADFVRETTWLRFLGFEDAQTDKFMSQADLEQLTPVDGGRWCKLHDVGLFAFGDTSKLEYPNDD